MNLADTLAKGVQAVRDGRFSDGIPLLKTVVEDPEFRAHPELQDLRARACSLLAQALLATEDPGPADRFARQAVDILEEAGDTVGLAEVEGLRREILACAVENRRVADQRARRARLREVPIDELVSAASDSAEAARMLMERSMAEHEAGESSAAIGLANRARNLADDHGSVKEQVLTRLLVAQVDSHQRVAALRSAYHLALTADQTGLIAGVARTAEQLDVPLSMVDGGTS